MASTRVKSQPRLMVKIVSLLVSHLTHFLAKFRPNLNLQFQTQVTLDQTESEGLWLMSLEHTFIGENLKITHRLILSL